MKLKLYKNGYIMLLTSIVFMMVSLVIIFGLATPIVKQIFASRDIWSAKQSYYLSEAGVEDVLFRIKDANYNQFVGALEEITLDGYGATTTFSGSLFGIEGLTVTTLSDQNGYNKKIETKVKKGSGITFIYGVQVGRGGFFMDGSSGINGNVFSAGDIIGCSSCFITGSAIVSNGSVIKDQSNEDPIPPTNSITFADTAATQDIAQSFKVSSTSALTQISLYIKKIGSPGSFTIKVVKNSGGSPSSNSNDVVATANFNSDLVTTNYDWVDVALSPNPNLTIGTTYWIVADFSGKESTSKKYIIGANLDTSYASGTSKIGSLGGSWTNTSYDSYFKVYLGEFFAKITGENENNKIDIGTATSDIAWAHNVFYTDSAGPIRCKNELDNNKACDTSYEDPSPATFPVSDGNITVWKDEALSGDVINGGYELIGSSQASLGPKKIIGDMHIGASGVLTVTGTLYITGKLIVDGSGKIQLAPSFGGNSGIIVVDGITDIGSSGVVKGTGQSGSYMMIVSNSTCPTGSCNDKPAINITGSGGAVILNAQKGTINFEGSANANEATANRITMSGSTRVTYQSGVANPNFSTGPSGGFEISSWKELSN